MSDNSNQESHSAGPIKTAKQFFWVSVSAFVVPMFVIIGLVFWITSGFDRSPGVTNAAEKLQERIAPVATFAIGKPGEQEAPAAGGAATTVAAAPAAAGGAEVGKKLYETTCFACHGTGAAGAPKLGDNAEWAPRMAEGMDAMMQIAIHGKGGMPPRGGSNATDEELHAAVVYMADASGGHFGDEAKPAEKAEAPKGAEPAAAAPAEKPAPAAEAAKPEATAAAAPAAGASSAPAIDLAAGKALYEKACIACHGSGVAGAPKYGDKGAWAPLIASGMDAMMNIAIHGKGAMPPRGATNASDAELRDAVEYMVEAAK